MSDWDRPTAIDTQVGGFGKSRIDLVFRACRTDITCLPPDGFFGIRDDGTVLESTVADKYRDLDYVGVGLSHKKLDELIERNRPATRIVNETASQNVAVGLINASFASLANHCG